MSTTTPTHRLVSREAQPENTVVRVGDTSFGGTQIPVIGGPCSVESRADTLLLAERLHRMGVQVMRGGVFKPRTSPYSFQGLGRDGLEILAEVRERFGMATVTEVMGTEEVDLVAEHVDVLQIGARNMQNYRLLEAIGKVDRPVLLKRGLSGTLDELLFAAEYVVANGNPNVILCERGIRTFETATRSTFDVNAVPALQLLTHLPVVVDPSHACGRAELVEPISRAAIAAGADGLIIEVHNDPATALSDGAQSLRPEAFEELLHSCSRIAAAVDRSLALGTPSSVTSANERRAADLKLCVSG